MTDTSGVTHLTDFTGSNWSMQSKSGNASFTLQNGNTVDFSVADLVAGLQSEITSNNKLSADLLTIII